MNVPHPAKASVALIGLGLMGDGMANRLLSAGFPLTVYNRSRAKAEPLGAKGARIALSPRDAAAGAQIIIGMVADDVASREIWLGPQGALGAAAPGTVLIESGTLTLGWIEELARAVAARGCSLLDAPVTGSKPQAIAGELRFLVGGAAADLEKARPVLEAMGKTIVHLGPTGSGARLKLINNFLAAVQIASLAEAIALIERTGLDRKLALEVLMSGAPGSPMMKGISGRMASSDFDNLNFRVSLMAKDIRYASAEGRLHGVPMTTAESTLKIFQGAIAAGLGDKDMSAVVEPLRQAPRSPL